MSDRDIALWLEDLGLSRYATAFAEHHIDRQALARLTGDDLKDMGIRSLGHRKKLLAAIAALPRATREAARKPASPGERRTVTVMFCDIAGFTRLSGASDPEDVHAMLNEFFELVDSAVQRYGGYVDKHIGDAVMAVFGAPVSHTNDPERAMRAAVDIQRSVAALSRPIQVHIGIASGQVVAAHMDNNEYTLTGRAVLVAGELQALAAPGQILISDRVHGHVAPWVRATALAPVTSKGMDEPITPWRLDGLRATQVLGPRPEFVGRHAEIARFVDILDHMRAHDRGAVLHICGEAGIGKTRLVHELGALAAERGVSCHMGLVLDFGEGTGQSAIMDMACSLLDVPRQRPVAERARAADRILASGHVAAKNDVYLHDLLDVPRSEAQRARYQAMSHKARHEGRQETLVELIAWRAARAPVLLVVEDVHWADSEVMGYIEHVGRAVAHMPALLVLTSRIRSPVDRLDDAGIDIVTMALAPLSAKEALVLTRRIVDKGTRLAQVYVDRAGGNPLFLEQLMRNAEESALDAVPESIQSIVQARIDRVRPGDKRALQCASIMGQRFSLSALRWLLDDSDYSCDALENHYLIQPAGEGEYLFAHALVLDAVYSSLLSEPRRRLHARAAQWFAGRDPVLYAEHLDRAGDAKAAQAYVDAARVLCDEYRFERALAMCEHARQRMEQIGKQAGSEQTGGKQTGSEQTGSEQTGREARYGVYCLLGDIKRTLGDVKGSIRAFDQADKLARSEDERCHAWLGQVEGMRIVDRTDEALELLDRAERLATEKARMDQLASIHYLRGSLRFPRGDIDGCLAEHTRARACAEQAGSIELEARALSGLADAAYMRGHVLTAHGHYDRCIERCRARGLASIEVANLPMRGLTHFFQLKVQAAVRDIQDAIAQAVLISNKRAQILAQGALGQIYYDLARHHDARRALDVQIELARAVGARRFEPIALLYQAKILARQGQHTQAQVTIEHALAVSRDTGFSFVGASVLGGMALVTRDPELRIRALDQGERALSDNPPGHNRLLFYRDAIDACLDAGDADRIERYAGALEAFTQAEPLPWTRLLAARGRALAAHLGGARHADHMATLRALHDRAKAAGLVLLAEPLERALNG